ncbi:family 5 glycosyl hydrolase [Mycobacterium xenopi 4042]|uniref:Family 5 glycosyl hydrolase n=1 Tax=Mycobacterium xenopi 4042 TaxID=1299334 RepID=X7ZZJ2_MYCXE|nr:family 5 glycosyl hydrolase [Mycobacterium xenopi 4042]
MLATAHPAYSAELDRQLEQTAGPGVGARRRAAGHGLGARADLREPRRCGAGDRRRDDSDRPPRSRRSPTTSPTPRSSSASKCPAQLPFEARTVALLNRGVPSFAVDTDGTLHTALMRSCTGWPSGIWIDEPRRSAPDGSGFQLQHWTHDFDYALVAAPATGDTPPSRPQRGVLPSAARRAGPRAPAGFPRSVAAARRTAGVVQLGALKAAATRWPAGGQSPSTPPSSPCGWSKPTAATPGPRRSTLARCQACVRGPAGRPAAASAGQRAARLPDRHAHRPPRDAPGARRPGRPGPEAEAAQPLTRATGCITAPRPRRRLPPSPTCTRTPWPPSGLRGGAAADRGQRLHRYRGARHPHPGMPARLGGRPASCR